MHQPETNSDGSKNPMASRKVLSHLQYIGFRSRELDQESDTYGVFNKDKDNASIKEFYDLIKNDKALQHSNTVKMHKMIIGFQREWFDRYGLNYKELVRHLMERFEERKGMKLDWVAAEHLKEKSPHTHIAIKSTGTDENGSTKRLKITKEDIDWIKNEIDRYTGREQYLSRDHELSRDDLVGDLLKEITKEVEKQAKEGERQTQQAKTKAERERNREGRDR
ncbi:hypothetical protein PUS82_00385 [Cytobacillus firmus]|uniref:plasmid recombination protein n=1 Tax=Cytobacillus firmus TaxID=1399 RepID=UPI00237A7BE1|nr:plasmid recombination protein [Cytobacillus firmus]MDD9309788.1 hypothetical protein [Cytobacillus firmus]